MAELSLLQAVAARVVGRGYLSADHLSTATGLDPAIMISKNGGNFANPAAGASVMTEIEATGWYYFALGAGDVDTLGPLIIRGTHATMDNIEVVYQVVSANTSGYEGGWVWFGAGGTAGTVSFVNGTALNPTSTMASARTIADALLIKGFRVLNGNTIALDQAYTGFTFYGYKWSLTLAVQAINNCYFEGATISGVQTGTGNVFNLCDFNNVTLRACELHDCGFAGTITIGAAGQFTMHECHSITAAGAATVIDFAAVGATTIRMPAWYGNLQVLNMAAGDVLVIGGMGKLELAASCTDGTVYIRGNIELSNLSAITGANLIDTSRYSEDQNVTNVTGAVTGAVGSVTGNVTGSVGSVVGQVTADIAAISGDATAADKLETMLDGTGGNTLSLGKLEILPASGMAVNIVGGVSNVAVQIAGGAGAGAMTIAGDTGGIFIQATGSGKALELAGISKDIDAKEIDALAQTGADSDTLETLSDQLDALATSSPGVGTGVLPITITDDHGNPLDGVEVWITSDASGLFVKASGFTDALGLCTLHPDPGTYYTWCQMAGYNNYYLSTNTVT